MQIFEGLYTATMIYPFLPVWFYILAWTGAVGSDELIIPAFHLVVRLRPLPSPSARRRGERAPTSAPELWIERD
jgi:hypothetical protein